MKLTFFPHSQTFAVLIDDDFVAKENYILFIHKGYTIMANRQSKTVVSVKSVKWMF